MPTISGRSTPIISWCSIKKGGMTIELAVSPLMKYR